MSDSVFREIVEQTRDVSILVLDPDGIIVLWNTGAQAIFGYRADEVIGHHFSILFVPSDLEQDMPAKELRRAAEDGSADDTRWHVGKNDRAVFVGGVTHALRDSSGQITGYSKFGRDITDRHRTERRLAAQLGLSNLLSEERPFEQTAGLVMQTICENLGWEIGVLWQVQGDWIVAVDHWQAPAIDAEAARALCEGHRFRCGVGLPGAVWERREAAWISDFRDAARFPRAELSAGAGVVAAFAFPILHAGHVTGAMEFFSVRPQEPDQAYLPVMTLIGAQIGDYIERRRTQQALKESEQRYRIVSATAQDAIFTIDEDSIITFCNPAVERLFGHKPEDLVGKRLHVIMPERYREQHDRGIRRYLETRTRNIPWTGVELPGLHKDGHEFPCEISFGEWVSDGRTIFTGFARDVTERKRALDEAEAARQQLQRRADEEASFRHLASALTGAVEMNDVLYEITNRATHVTRADGVYVERILEHGSTKGVEVVSSSGRGAPPRGTRVSFPGSMTDEMIRGGAPVILADMRSFGRSMAPYLADTCPSCEVLVTPLIAENEPLGALVLLNSRASGRHFTDGDIVRARTLGDLTSLALRRVRLMEQEREAKERAEAAVRVRDETLGIVSHDLRNPLTKIALSVDLFAGADAGEQAELIDTIRASARQMDRLIQDLLDVARVEAGGLAVSKEEEVDPAALLREVCASHTPIAEQRQQRIVCELEEPLPLICADRDRLLQVFGNLIGNALKFTPPRGTITVTARARGDVVEMIVRDTGPGIPKADLKNVFTPYWQAKKTAHMGAGLGLAIVRGIVEAHGGTVWAEHAPGGGAQFRFTIPVA